MYIKELIKAVRGLKAETRRRGSDHEVRVKICFERVGYVSDFLVRDSDVDVIKQMEAQVKSELVQKLYAGIANEVREIVHLGHSQEAFDRMKALCRLLEPDAWDLTEKEGPPNER
jgi:hypothetical protein